MSYKKLWIFLCLFFCLSYPSLQGITAEPQEIRIQLMTDSPLSPIYLSRITSSDHSFSAQYVKELETIFNYDFSHNGKTKVLSQSPEKEKQLTSSSLNVQDLKQLGVPYVVVFSIKNKQLSSSVYNMLSMSAKHFPEISLSGNLSQDRRIVHKLSDSIHKILFDTDGIANSRILFSYQFKNPNTEGSSWISEIWECDWDGENARPVTKENSYCVTPVMIPKSANFNKDLFLYVSYKTGQPKIFIASLEEGKGKKVVDIRGNQLLPAISKQRDKIAFICDASGRTDLFIQPIRPESGLTGTPQQLFSYPRSTQASPTFSPDGSKVAFVSDKDGAARIYTISTQATNKRPAAQLLTKKNRENSCPCWSPDGTKLAYSAKTDGIRQIWIYDFATGEERQLTSGPGNKENPCWASNSLHIIFNSTDGTFSDLYVVNMNQPDVVKITKGTGKKHYPTWGAR
jgi:TolB protein